MRRFRALRPGHRRVGRAGLVVGIVVAGVILGVLATLLVLVAPAATRAAGGFFLLIAGQRALFFQERLTVGDRDLIIIGVDLGKGEETVPVTAVIDESGLQRGFDPRYLGKVDVASQLALVDGFEIEFLDLVAIQNDNAGLFRMCRVNK